MRDRLEACYIEDRGDGALILVPADIPKTLLVSGLPRFLAAELTAHNTVTDGAASIRMRLALHAGEVQHDVHGVAGSAINLAFRLMEADDLKRALRESAGTLVTIASDWVFDEVIRYDAKNEPAPYRRVQVQVKETAARAWLCRPDDPYPPSDQRRTRPAACRRTDRSVRKRL